jgi:uncharacterized coiled-coil protein SlyX
MSQFADKLRKAASAAATIIKTKAPGAIEALEEISETDFGRQLGELGVDVEGDPEQSALAAIAEAQSYALDLARQVAAKERTVNSLQDSIVEQQATMEEFVRVGASDQLFYLTEYMQQRFPTDFDPANQSEDIVDMAKRLLVELQQRREGKLQFVTKERFLAALQTALTQLVAEAEVATPTDYSELVLNDHGHFLFAWQSLKERIKTILALRDVDDMRIDWVLTDEAELGLVSRIVGSCHYYGQKPIEGSE